MRYDDTEFQFVRTTDLRRGRRRLAILSAAIACLVFGATVALLVPYRNGAGKTDMPSPAVRETAVDLALSLRDRSAAPAERAELRSLVKIALKSPSAAARQWAPVLLPALGRARMDAECEALLAHLDPQSGAAYARRRAAAAVRETEDEVAAFVRQCRSQEALVPIRQGVCRRVMRERLGAIHQSAARRREDDPPRYVGPPLLLVSP